LPEVVNGGSEAAKISGQYAWIASQAPTNARPPSLFCDTSWQTIRSDRANHWLRNALAASLG
jgi:hypothetical protein